MNPTRRQVIAGATITFAALSMQRSWAQSALRPDQDRVFICNEDSNTLAVIDPNSNAVVHTVNLTSFDEDPRPPFRLVTGGVTPTHLAMVRKPLYHGAIDIHGAAPSPDNLLIATTGRGTSNVYLIDAASLRVIGNVPNAQASDTTNKDRITSGLLVGREPHEPTFTRNGAELWVTVRGEGRIAILDVAAAKAGQPTERALRGYLDTINGPAQAWFSKDGKLAFVASQKVSQVDVFETNFGSDGYSQPKRAKTVDINAQDPRAFTPFLKTSPDGGEVWFSHKLADAVSGLDCKFGPTAVGHGGARR
jgi:YVTN family beta-propeller protein